MKNYVIQRVSGTPDWSGTELGLVEVTVGNDLGVGLVGGVGVNVGHVAGEGLAAHGEGGGVEHVQGAGLQQRLSIGINRIYHFS